MRKILLALLVLILPILSSAQEKFTLKPFVEYSYNPTLSHNGAIAAVADYKIIPNFSVSAGLYANTAKFNAVMAEAKVDIAQFYLKNKYLYRAFHRSNTQELATSVILGYKLDHWDFQLGYNIRFFTQLKSEVYNYLIEPANILYSIEYKVFTKENRWNIGARLSNIDYFIMERYNSPIYSLLADYRINDNLNLFATLSSIPSGAFNCSVAYLSCNFKFGLEILW